MGTLHIVRLLWLNAFLLFGICTASIQTVGRISPVFQGSQMNWIDHEGLFLLSNDSSFAFGFVTTSDVTAFSLAIIHLSTKSMVWSANRDSPVKMSDKFVFDATGNAFLQKGGSVVWSTDSGGKGVSVMELRDSGNLVLLGNNSGVIWQSFSHPTDTLLSKQEFAEGMKLVSQKSKNLSYTLEIKSGDMILSAAYGTPQPYWSMGDDTRKIVNEDGGQVASASLDANSWNFYDQSRTLLWQFRISTNTDPNATWITVLGNDGIISFTNLQSGDPSPTRIPDDPCGTPEPCDPYLICSSNKICRCLSTLSTHANCGSGINSPCDPSASPVDLISAGDSISYFALAYVSPSLQADLSGCKSSCLANCSCLAMFFQNSTGNCYLFNDVGAFIASDSSSGFTAMIKVSSKGGAAGTPGGSGSSKKRVILVVVISLVTVLLIFGLIYGGFRWYSSRGRFPEPHEETSEEENFLENLAGMPTRFSYRDLQTATDNFTRKLGQGGFGSVYQGVLPDGTRLAVKKLEGIGQGKKEFRAEVSIIGSIHHHHLVRLKGFCAEGSHRLLVYEFMANGSLDKWIFKQNKDNLLDWETRFNIALGTAKGLAYLHEDCDVKIVHCDIKPENVLLDDSFRAKVSDFGLAKLMTREQSHVFTTMRGTRGYLAPEWITNYAISEKSDVYSYGMLLLEIIGGRKNYDPSESSEKSHFPSFAFKMMEEGKLRDIIDSNIKYEGQDDRVPIAIKVALWCIQEDMHIRPPMTKVVQMLEGLCSVPMPPVSSPLGTRLFSSMFKSISGEGTSSGPSDCNSDTHLSAVRLSGPR
ncbi:Receptor-like serine/threonine-protein kinase [Psidium guajava]|nr:Receptor-like serine/threonine-protein kinase [Psidium guajava]